MVAVSRDVAADLAGFWAGRFRGVGVAPATGVDDSPGYEEAFAVVDDADGVALGEGGGSVVVVEEGEGVIITVGGSVVG